MMDSITLSEKSLLKKIQWRLVIWLVIAFVLFEAGFAVGTFYVLENQLTYQNQKTMEQLMLPRIHEAIDLLQSDQQDQQSSPNSDSTHDLNAVWIVTKGGYVLRNGASPIANANAVKHLVINERISAGHDKNPHFDTVTISGVPLLVGVFPIFNEAHFLGYLASVSSLAEMTRTLHELYLIDLYLGLVGLVAILLMTKVLSGRALIPIRNALSRQRNFVNDAAHELRTPLAILRGTLELAQGEEDAQVIQESLQDGLYEVDYLSSLVGNLSTLARMESGIMEMDVQTVDLREITQSVTQALLPMYEASHVTLTVEQLDQAVLRGDPVRLRQLLLILLENAMKYNVENGKVHVNLKSARQGWLLTIEDTGLGISEEDLPHIFDRFFRSLKTASYQEGSGLGLAIAAWIIDRHKGRVTVQSKVGSGTTFTVWFPQH